MMNVSNNFYKLRLSMNIFNSYYRSIQTLSDIDTTLLSVNTFQ